jgi:hypothetical protein
MDKNANSISLAVQFNKYWNEMVKLARDADKLSENVWNTSRRILNGSKYSRTAFKKTGE